MLLALSASDEPLSAVGLARRVGLHPTTTLRMLESLRSRGMVRTLGGGAYELGPRVMDLSHAFLRRLSISRHANELAEELARRTGETASVGVLDDGRVLYIAIAHGQSELGIQALAFARHPLHCTALGKVLLAELPWDQAAAILARHPLDRMTPKTQVEPAALRAELERCAARGWGQDDEERVAGVRCLAAPIRDHSGAVVAAISVSGPAFRIARHGVEAVAAAVMAMAAEASARLGAPTMRAKAAGS